MSTSERSHTTTALDRATSSSTTTVRANRSIWVLTPAAALGQRDAAAGLLVDHVGVHALRAEPGGDRVADRALAGVVAARDRVAAGG